MAADRPGAPGLAPPSALLFDWDNTLVDNWLSIVDAMNVTLVAMGHRPWDAAEARRRIRRSMRESFPLLFGDRWTEAQRIFYERFEAAHLNALRPLPGADAMLERLSAAGVYLGVVSNKRGRLLRLEAAELGWARYFATVVGANDAARDNPAGALRYLGRRLGFRTQSGRPDPCLDPAYCDTLNQTYLEQCLRFRGLGSGCLEIHHEDLLGDPVAAARELARFTGADADERRMEWATGLVRHPG